MLREKVKQLESELGIVKWYITIMEDGIDSKQVVKEYVELKATHKSFVDNTDARIDKLIDECKRITKKYEESLLAITKQQE